MNYPWKKLYVRKDCDLPTMSACIYTAYDIIWKYTHQKREYLFVFLKNNDIHYYIHGVDEFAPGRPLYRKKYFSPAAMKKSFAKGLKFIKNTRAKAQKWPAQLARELNQKNLAAAFKDFRQDFKVINYEYSILPWWALESWQHDFLDTFNYLIKKNNLEAKQDLILSSVLRPWRQTAIQEIQSKFKAGVPINKLVVDYQFLRSWTVVWHKPINAEWIKGVCQKKISKEKHLALKEVIRLLQPNAHEKKYLETAPYVCFFKNWRDDLRRKHAFAWTFLFEDIAKFFNIPYDDIGYFTLDEISDILRIGFMDKELIQDRKKNGCVLTVTPGRLQIKVVADEACGRYKKIVETVESAEVAAVIKGITGQAGKIVGKVRTVRHYKDVFKVKNGEVLVANTTHPNYLIGMKKAAAFVTDEGGIACHAAIVAREMRKPCIVGTKIATKALKDGDLVEVDANHGIVTKLRIGTC